MASHCGFDICPYGPPCCPEPETAPVDEPTAEILYQHYLRQYYKRFTAMGPSKAYMIKEYHKYKMTFKEFVENDCCDNGARPPPGEEQEEFNSKQDAKYKQWELTQPQLHPQPKPFM